MRRDKTKPKRVRQLHEVWGKNVRRWRERRRLSQDELADDARVAQSQISQIERGAAPSDAVKMRLAEALGCSLDDLFAWPPFLVPEQQQNAA